jgi:hypothetical protein
MVIITQKQNEKIDVTPLNSSGNKYTPMIKPEFEKSLKNMVDTAIALRDEKQYIVLLSILS